MDEPIAPDQAEEPLGETPETAVAEEAAEPELAALEEPAAEPAPEPEAPAEAEAPDQLSLDEMVGSLREDAPEASPETTGAEDAAPEAPAEATEGEPEAGAAPEGAAEPAPAPAGDIAPDLALAPVLARERLAARLPFWILGGMWAAFVVTFAVLLWPLAGAPFTSQVLYAYFVLGGVALTAVGPVLALVMWAFLRGAEPDLRAGLARAVFLRAAIWTLAGAAMWWTVLVLLDLHRAGTIG